MIQHNLIHFLSQLLSAWHLTCYAFKGYVRHSKTTLGRCRRGTMLLSASPLCRKHFAERILLLLIENISLQLKKSRTRAGLRLEHRTLRFDAKHCQLWR